MAATIRLSRVGKGPHKRPFFRIIVADKRKSRDSAYLEELGQYNPLTGELKLKLERLDYWVKNGAQVTEAVKNLAKRARKGE